MLTQFENTLDVTILEPKQKHPTIFVRFDELNPGEALTIHNDHDPKPLYYQLLGERGNIFNWEYLEEGPEWWKVRITKKKDGENEESIGQMAAKDIRKAQIFKKYGLDFCCGGKKSVKEACLAKGLDVIKVEKELQDAEKNIAINGSGRPVEYTKWSLDFLIDYIVNTHHNYVKSSLPDIVAYAEKVNRVHGQRHVQLFQINELVKAINNELTAHLMKEEKILFPYIKSLVAVKNGELKNFSASFGSVQSPIIMMEMEHEMVGQNLTLIRELSNNFKLPEDACSSYSLLYRFLEEFEEDLHMHIHLENNILFPKALELEQESKK
ncbi:MAG: iron-sulfur cluster repair di-iron protein [Sediminibacterium sp.]|nr:MAG: iron-sulfur cluster repair di-iron protein [Sediminibacterium sp.] [Sediminibacterium sp. FEMGT703S]